MASSTPDNDVYTVLVGISAVVLLASVIYVLLRFGALFGTYNPFA